MQRIHRSLVSGLLATALITILSQTADAQSLTRKGVLTRNLVRTLVAQRTTLTQGVLAELPNDANFAGDYQAVFQDAARILEGYTIVERGGNFPENQGIPRSQQLAKVEVVYSIYALPNGLELFLYRSPVENTSQYFIRRKQ
jgi:hypothetical protein